MNRKLYLLIARVLAIMLVVMCAFPFSSFWNWLGIVVALVILTLVAQAEGRGEARPYGK